MLFAFSLQILYHKKSRLSIPSSKKNAKKCGFSDKIPYFFEKWSFFYFIIKTAARRANWDRQYTCRAKDKTIGLSQNKTYKSYKTYESGLTGAARDGYRSRCLPDNGIGNTSAEKNGTRERNRTSDQKFRKLLLYPLSYPGTLFIIYHCYR